MIACLSPGSFSFDYSLNTLQYAALLKGDLNGDKGRRKGATMRSLSPMKSKGKQETTESRRVGIGIKRAGTQIEKGYLEGRLGGGSVERIPKVKSKRKVPDSLAQNGNIQARQIIKKNPKNSGYIQARRGNNTRGRIQSSSENSGDSSSSTSGSQSSGESGSENSSKISNSKKYKINNIEVSSDRVSDPETPRDERRNQNYIPEIVIEENYKKNKNSKKSKKSKNPQKVQEQAQIITYSNKQPSSMEVSSRSLQKPWKTRNQRVKKDEEIQEKSRRIDQKPLKTNKKSKKRRTNPSTSHHSKLNQFSDKKSPSGPSLQDRYLQHKEYNNKTSSSRGDFQNQNTRSPQVSPSNKKYETPHDQAIMSAEESFFKSYVEGLKKEAALIKEESSLVVECSSNWKRSFHKNKKLVAKTLKEKIALLNELQAMLAGIGTEPSGL